MAWKVQRMIVYSSGQDLSHTLCFELCLTKNKLGNTLSGITRSTKTYGSRNMEPMVPNKGFHQFPQSLQINSFLFPIKYPRVAALKLWWYRMPQHVLPCPGKSRTHSIVVGSRQPWLQMYFHQSTKNTCINLLIIF